MNELFVRFFLTELRKNDFTKAFYDREQSRVIISPEYSRFYVTYEDGEYLTHYDKESRAFLTKVKTVLNWARVLAFKWDHSAPMRGENLGRFKNLLEWNSIVLAARDDGARGLHYVTWQRSAADRRSVGHGYYTDSITAAMKNFAGRSGLYPSELMFNSTQIDLIRSALAYRLEHDGELSLDAEDQMKAILDSLYDEENGPA